MKIIYLTDIHDALRDLRVLLSTTEADIYLLSGDILYKAFYDDEKTYQFVCLQEEFYTLARNLKKKIYPFDLASDILRFPDRYNDDVELQKKAADYRHLFEKAAKTMKEKYALIESLIVKYGQAECLMLPGNYDIDLRYTALRDRDLHQKEIRLKGLEFAGYGGAPIATSGIPEKLAVVYHESQEGGKLFSDPEDFFEDKRPDVMVIHNPAYGYLDQVPGIGHVGSLGIRNYLDVHHPELVVSGHVHEDYGVCLRNGTILLNSSNFGGVDSPYGWQAGGAYAELYLEKKKVQKLNLMRLIGDKHYHLMEIERDGDTLQGKIVEENRDKSHLNLDMIVRDSSGSPMQ
ncbi:MAG: metallophosphoesterase [Spirochaetales bacterium]|nr:metallophosphoesterase [Leptospiraceae bacterium]MCP5480298.1 metallophosphoesterase [Spirochaetales bacterium]MCP5486934.1 metallophosphoesterase [Spirochaetales bacterium]